MLVTPQSQHVVFIGRQEKIEGGALANLAIEVP